MKGSRVKFNGNDVERDSDWTFQKVVNIMNWIDGTFVLNFQMFSIRYRPS